MTGFLHGCVTAMITPFCGSGVNYESLGKMMDFQIASGVDALCILGTTGEPATMSEEERLKTVSFAVERAAGRVKIVVGTGSNSTAQAVEKARRAEELGADGVLAITPYYNKCTQRGLLAYYEAICNAVKLPVVAYHVPCRTGVSMLPETAEKLAKISNFAGIKEASGDMALTLDILRRIRGKCDVYSGEDLLNLPILCAGGAAVFSVVSNVVPKAVCELTKAVSERKLYMANKLADKLFPLTKALFSEVNPIPVKEAMNLLGFAAGKPRSPLTPLEEAHRELLKTEMIKFGLEVKA